MKFTLKIPEETKQLWRSLWHNRWLRYATYLLGITIPLTIYAALISIPHTFTGGQLVRAGEVNTNFKTLYDTLGITEAKGLTVGANIEAQGFTLNGTPVGSSSDSFWSVAGSPNISYNGGNVGIGITPTTTLHVNGTTTLAGATAINGDTVMKGSTGATGAAALDVQNSGGTSMMYVRNDGNVGIGTTSPTTLLKVARNMSDSVTIASFTNDNSSSTGAGLLIRTLGTGDPLVIKDGSTAPSAVSFVVKDGGNVGIGTGATNPSEKLQVNGTIYASTGNSGCKMGAATNPSCTSDRRLKEKILPLENSLDKIIQLNGIYFQWKNSKIDNKAKHIGVIAQDVEKVFPEIVDTDKKTGFKAVSYASLVAPLIESTKALKIRDDAKTKKIKELEAKNAQLEARLDRIERMMARAN